ncbi:MAG TPA: FecR domain-containing protein [Chryseolinea sp.]|nr:FecR domain-containing protein [Chryseolinea sp.]
MLESFLKGTLSASQMIKLNVWHQTMQSNNVKGRIFNKDDEEALFHIINSEASTLEQIKSFRPYHYQYTPLGRKLPFQLTATLIFIIAVGSVTWYHTHSKPREKINDQIESLILEDGTTIMMTKSSTLSYYEQQGGRFLTFDGEAMIDVAYGSMSPFTISCGNNSLIVHGGHVSLRSDPRGCELRIMSQEL